MDGSVRSRKVDHNRQSRRGTHTTYRRTANKTPLLPESNREIGGSAPSLCSAKIVKKAEIEQGEFRHRISLAGM